MASKNPFSLNGSPNRNTGSVAEPESEMAALHRRHDQYKLYDIQKASFVNVRERQ